MSYKVLFFRLSFAKFKFSTYSSDSSFDALIWFNNIIVAPEIVIGKI